MFESMEEKNFSFFRFEDLRIYHKALDFATFVYQNTTAFPEDLKRDFLDTSTNIVLSIAQGSFYGKAQFINILKEVRDAIRSCVVYTAIGQRVGAFSETQNEESTIHLQELSKMLGAFIGSLKKQTGHSQSDEVSPEVLEID
jgi:four helix bundle protein